MTFEDYSPKERRISGQRHLASWLILAALVGILAFAAPTASSGDADKHIAAATQEDCAV